MSRRALSMPKELTGKKWTKAQREKVKRLASMWGESTVIAIRDGFSGWVTGSRATVAAHYGHIYLMLKKAPKGPGREAKAKTPPLLRHKNP